MPNLMVVVLAATAVSCVAAADEKPAPPKGPVPEVVRAQAVEKDGAWVIRVSIPETRSAGMKDVPDPTGKTTGVIIPVEETGWFDYDLPLDGRQVRALGVDGKAIDPKDLSKRLAKPSRVVLFRGTGEPDPHYLGVLRDDVVVLIATSDKFKAPAPKK